MCAEGRHLRSYDNKYLEKIVIAEGSGKADENMTARDSILRICLQTYIHNLKFLTVWLSWDFWVCFVETMENSGFSGQDKKKNIYILRKLFWES